MKRQLASAMVVGIFAVLGVGSDGGNYPPPGGQGDRVAAAPAHTNTHFAHGTMNVRSGPGERFRVVRQLARGDTLSLGPADERGWAPVLGADSAFVFTRLGLIRTDMPVEAPSYAEEGVCATAMHEVHQRMNRAPDDVKRFSEAGLEEVTWWYRENPRDVVPRYQYSFLWGPYDEECRTSTIEN